MAAASGVWSSTAGSFERAARSRPPAERPRTVAEAADELGLSVYTIRAWIASRRIGHIRLGRAIRIPADELRRVIEAGTVPAEPK